MTLETILKQVRRQFNEYQIQFNDFLNQSSKEEIITSKVIKGWLQMGVVVEFGVPITITFDRVGHTGPTGDKMARLTINRENSPCYLCEIGMAEYIKLYPSVIESFVPYARENLILSINKYSNDSRPIADCSNEELMEYVKGYRKDYVGRIADRLMSHINQGPLRAIGLTDAQSYHERKVSFLEDLYVEYFGELP